MARKIKKSSGAGKRVVFKISLLVFTAYLVYSMISLQTELIQNRKILSEKQAEISSLKVSNKELNNLLKNGSEDELIERAAREKLDFVYANEEVYEDIKGN